MKTLINLSCPQCNATLSVEEDRDMLFCSYCGHKILLNDENKHTIHYIDDAAIKRAETERMIQLKELEMEEKKRANKKVAVIIWLVITIVLGVIGICGMPMCLLLAIFVGVWGAIGLFEFPAANKKKETARVVNEDEVQITDKLRYYREKHYETIYGLYKTAGFVNISTIPLHDLKLFELKKDGLVKEITINGEDDFDEGDIFKKTEPVVIMFHSTKQNFFI